MLYSFLDWTPQAPESYTPALSLIHEVRLDRPRSWSSARQAPYLWKNRHNRNMKANRNVRRMSRSAVKLTIATALVVLCCSFLYPHSSHADQDSAQAVVQTLTDTGIPSDPEAIALVQQMLDFIGNGPAFDAKVRETVWTSGREVVGVGTYEQAGGGSGKYNLQVTMHDGDGKHRLQQISDGKLAWTRTDIAGKVSLRRVDVGRLEEWVRGITDPSSVSPKLKVGAWGELLDSLQRDYSLRTDTAKLKSTPAGQPEPMRVVIGDLKRERRTQVLADAERSEWPFLYPTRVHVAVKAKTDTDTGLGQWVPARIEFWSDPFAGTDAEGKPKSRRRLITLIELYSLRQIEPPPSERFRFENQDAEVNFINETDRYVESYGVNLTQGERQQLWR